jgi:uncharacterized membrane protein
MKRPSRHANDLEHRVHSTLRAGVTASGALLFLGLALLLATDQPRPEGPPATFPNLLWTAIRGDGVSIVDVALLLLMATPLLRVAVLAVGWTFGGDRRFGLVAFAVLGLLALSVALGMR